MEGSGSGPEGQCAESKRSFSFSVVMAYHNRLEQTINTLHRFIPLYAGKYDFEVIIVDDGSEPDQDLTPFVTGNHFPYKVILIKLAKEKKTWINPVVPYNVGFHFASKDVMFIQNPEIYHCDDLFDYYLKNCKLDVYYTFPVFCSPSFSHNKQLRDLSSEQIPDGKMIYQEFMQKINYLDFQFDFDYYKALYPEFENCSPEDAELHWLRHGIREGRTCNASGIFYRRNIVHDWRGWYNHIEYNKRNLHFLSVISREEFQKKIGGFDLEFKDGLWYDDNDFVERIAKVFPIETIDSNQYMGIHQYHTSGSDDQLLRPDFGDLVHKNRQLFETNMNIMTPANAFKQNDVIHHITTFTYITN